jgi:hypothetical protein
MRSPSSHDRIRGGSPSTEVHGTPVPATDLRAASPQPATLRAPDRNGRRCRA